MKLLLKILFISFSFFFSIISATAYETTSYVRTNAGKVPADGTSVCSVVITINDTYGFPITNKLVTLQTTRGNSDTINDSLGGSVNPQTTNVNGQCTWTIKSLYAGEDTVTATCDGVTIASNLISNPSMEEGAGTPSGWSANGILSKDTTEFYSGGASARITRADTGTSGFYQTNLPINRGATYRISFYAKASVIKAGSVSVKQWVTWENCGLAEGFTLGTSWGYNLYTFTASGNFVGDDINDAYIEFNVYQTSSETWWIDDVKLVRAPTVYFTATRLKITTPQRTVGAGVSSDSIVVEAQGNTGGLDVLFNNTITLQTSSSTGKFSISNITWADTTNIYLSNGTRTFYYRNTTIGIHTITVSRSGFISDTQLISVTVVVVSESTSYLSVNFSKTIADGTSLCTVTITIKDNLGNSIQNKQVTISAARGSSYDSITQPAPTDVNGQCTGTIWSSYAGDDTITAVCDTATITYMFFDGFSSYAEGSNGSPIWTPVIGTWMVESGEYSESETAVEYYRTEMRQREFEDFTCSARVKFVSGPERKAGIVFRSQPGGYWSHYIFRLSPTNQWVLYDADGWRTLASGAFATAVETWYTLKVEVKGRNIKCYIDGNNVADVQDSAYSKGHIGLYNEACHSHFDDVKVYPCWVNFTASKLKFISTPFTTTQNNPSPTIIVQAQDNMNNRDTNFNETVTLFTSSPGGKFSVDRVSWTDTSIITFSGGSATFYYKDSSIGNPVLTAYRVLLATDTQTEIILAQGVNETASYIVFTPYQIPASGVNSATTVVTINDTYGFPITNKLVTLQTTRGNSDTIQDSMGAVNSKQYTDNNGMCTWTIKSLYAGWDTITVTSDGKTITRGVNKYGAVGIWHFDTDTRDVSGYGNNGALYNGVVWTSAPDSAAQGSALQFDGIDDYVRVEDSTNLRLSGDWTLEAWVKPTGNGSNENWIIEKVNNYGMHVENDRKVYGRFYDGGSWISTTSNGLAPLNQWTHSVVTWEDSIKKMSIYINGNFDISSTKTTEPVTDANPLTFGGSSVANFIQFKGIIDEPRVYNRALTADEIKADYEKKANIYFTATRLKITTPQRTVIAGMASDSICVEGRGNIGTEKDLSFNETVTLSSSFPSGKFSLSNTSWADTNEIKLNNGSGVFYYRDIIADSPVITVSRSGLQPDTQVVNITANPALASDTQSYLRISSSNIPANGFTSCSVTITLRDGSGTPVPGKSVTIYTSRGSLFDTIIQPAGLGYPITDANGQCTGAIKSGYCGEDTVTASSDAGTITYMFFDDFSTYSEGSNGSPIWTPVVGTWQVESGEYSQSETAVEYYHTEMREREFGDFTYSAKVKFISGPERRAGICFRWQQGSFNHYVFRLYLNGWYLFDANGWRTLVSGAFTTTTGVWYTLKVEVKGRNIKCYIDGNNVADVNDNTYSKGHIGLYNEACHSHFDDVKVYPCWINWTASKAGIGSSAFKIKAGFTSPQATARAQGSIGGVDTSINTTVILISSSNSGCFSLNGSSWTSPGESLTISLTNGEGTFYYKDYRIGNSIITVSHIYSQLDTGTQMETITASQMSFISSPFTLFSNQTSNTITVVAQDSLGNTDTNWNETVSLLSGSPAGRFSLSKTPWSDTTAIKFNSGTLAFFYKDKRAGNPTIITVLSYDLTGTQNETVSMPIIVVGNYQRNERLSSDTVSLPIIATSGDTVEWTLNISNTGLESAANVIITDTLAFDTTVYTPVYFISMDTSSIDSWTYALNTPTNWQPYNNTPQSGAGNIKGLRWRINTLNANSQKNVKFRVRIK